MRSLVRTILRDLIAEALPNATVLKFRKADPKGVSPLVMVCSGGSRRPRTTVKGSMPNHTIRVYSMVIHSDKEAGFTEEMAEDLIDSNEQAIGEVIDGNQKTVAWKRIEPADESIVERVEIGGVLYLLEIMLFSVEELK